MVKRMIIRVIKWSNYPVDEVHWKDNCSYHFRITDDFMICAPVCAALLEFISRFHLATERTPLNLSADLNSAHAESTPVWSLKDY